MNRDIANLVGGCASMLGIVAGTLFWLWCVSWDVWLFLSQATAFFCYALMVAGLWVFLSAHLELGFVKHVDQPFYTLRWAAIFFLIAYVLLMLRWWDFL